MSEQLISLIGGTATGFLFKYWAQRAQDQINDPGFYWVGLVYDAAVDQVERASGSGANPLPTTGSIANYQGYGLFTGLTFGDPPSSLNGNKFTFLDNAITPLPQIVLSSQLQNIIIQKG